MDYLVIVRAEAPNQFVAQAWGIPELLAVAPTEAEAVDRLRQSLTEWLATAKLVRVEVPINGASNPWLDSFGRSATDPEFESYLDEIQRARSVDVAE